MSRILNFIPLILLVPGIFLGTLIEDDKPAPYYFGSGLGFVFVTLLPACLFALIHWLVVRKNATPELRENYDVLDAEKAIITKNYWYYCVRYQAVIGVFFFLAILANKGKL